VPPRIAVCIFRLLPFHRSASVKPILPLREKPPTAVQAVIDVHDTPNRVLSVAPAGSGVVWIDQRAPFHRSAKAVPEDDPTAVQAASDVHDTPDRALSVSAGFGVVWIDQLTRFQRSANGKNVVAPA
jgi:hypothetical protein